MTSHRNVTAILLGSLVFAIGCGSTDSGSAGPAAPTFTQITTDVITTKACGGPFCHSLTAGGFKLDSPSALYDELVGANAAATGPKCDTSGFSRVVPGNPDKSLLYLKLKYTQPCGDGMPSTNPLDPAKVEMVRAWIAAGAKND